MKLLLTLLSLISSEGLRVYPSYKRGGGGAFIGSYPGGYGRGDGVSYDGSSQRGFRGQNYDKQRYNGLKGFRSGRERYGARNGQQYKQRRFNNRRNRGYGAQRRGNNTHIGKQARKRGYQNQGYGGRQQTRRRGQQGSRYANNNKHNRGLYKRGTQSRKNARRTRAQNMDRAHGSRQGRSNVYQGRKKDRSMAQRGARNNYSRNGGKRKSTKISFDKDDEKSYSKNKTKFDMESSSDDYSSDKGNSNIFSAKNRDASDTKFGKDERNKMGYGSDKGVHYDSWNQDADSQDTRYQMNDQASKSARANQFAGYGQDKRASKYGRNARAYDSAARNHLKHGQHDAAQYDYARADNKGLYNSGQSGAIVSKDRAAIGGFQQYQGGQEAGASLALNQNNRYGANSRRGDYGYPDY